MSNDKKYVRGAKKENNNTTFTIVGIVVILCLIICIVIVSSNDNSLNNPVVATLPVSVQNEELVTTDANIVPQKEEIQVNNVSEEVITNDETVIDSKIEEKETVKEEETIVESVPESVKTFELKDDYFLTSLDDIYLNADNYYEGRLTYEGLIFIDETFNNEFFVTGRRYYCCGTDSYIVGLECEYDPSSGMTVFPENDAWVKISGIIKKRTDMNGVAYPYLSVDSVTVLETRGMELVYN